MTISVIIPIYNVSAYIERCIHSVMNQTYHDIECILVDDASPDDSIDKCKQMIEAYNGPIFFRILHHSENRGLSAARNTGTEAATGSYILYIDSDDAITPDCVEKLTKPVLHDSTIEMVLGNAKRLYEGRKPQTMVPIKQDYLDIKGLKAVRDYFFTTRSVFAWNRLVRRDFLNKMGISFKEGILWEDYLWTFYIMKHLCHLYVIKDITYLHYKRPDSITTGTDLKTKQIHLGLVHNEISNNFTPGDSIREIRCYLGRFCFNYLDNSKSMLYKATAQNFRRELSFIQNPLECLLLYTTDMMSKFYVGIILSHKLMNTYKSIRKKLVFHNR